MPSEVAMERVRRYLKEDGQSEVRPEGCICEMGSDISLIWRDKRNEFGYTGVRRNWGCMAWKKEYKIIYIETAVIGER